MFSYALKGDSFYYLWVLLLLSLSVGGVIAYSHQLSQGFIVTNMSNHVSWGAYIANFTYLVGIAAAAVLLVLPTYVHGNKDIKEVVLIGELLALCAIIMCLLFILVDLGRPDHFWHIIPFVGKLNFPTSILAWDVVVLNGYLVINLFIPGYLLYKEYLGQEPSKKLYLPFIYISIVWAISIHTVTAFLYVGFGGKPYWNSAILAPRFLISAFTCGPALLILLFQVLSKFTSLEVKSSVFKYLKSIMIYALISNLFLLGCELYKEFYTDSLHTASVKYLFFGLHGHNMLVPYIRTGLALEGIALFIILVPRLRNTLFLLNTACFFIIIGIWIEKGMGLLIPGFIPSALGDIVEYTPSKIEFFVCLGVWSFGALIFTVISKVAIAIQTGKLRYEPVFK
ncbi:MAG: polysulfide reductase NrfD [Deltaproteobacteria bacterium]|nr:polysulfide reductase NrfD [Deltaproteobacteria bacterium]